MTTPRCILAGKTYFITRRCSERRFFLKPDPVVSTTFLFCLAVAATRHGVEVHAVCVMSNHYHLVVTDARGELPLFMAWLNRHTAICLKIHRKRAGDFWSAAEKYSAMELVGPGAVWKYIVYTLANPTKAGLVRHGRDWPGLRLGPEAWLREPIQVPPPGLFFKPSEAPAVTALRSFRAWYRRAYQCFCQGEAQAEFPPGTWNMARRFGAQVASG